jgi:hypothetical protein
MREPIFLQPWEVSFGKMFKTFSEFERTEHRDPAARGFFREREMLRGRIARMLDPFVARIARARKIVTKSEQDGPAEELRRGFAYPPVNRHAYPLSS